MTLKKGDRVRVVKYLDKGVLTDLPKSKQWSGKVTDPNGFGDKVHLETDTGWACAPLEFLEKG